MSFLSGQTTPVDKGPKFLGVDADRLASAEQARPVPWLAGRQRLAITFISRAFNLKTRNVEKDGGLFGGSQKLGTDYYISFAAAICLGPIDGLHAIFFDGDKIWPESGDGLTRPSAANWSAAISYSAGFKVRWNGDNYVSLASGNLNHLPSDPAWWSPADLSVSFTLTARKNTPVTLYWGGNTQLADPHLNDTTLADPSGQQHPPYRGVAYLVFNRLYIGRNASNVPNIEVIVSRYPAPAWSSESPVLFNDANPAHIYYDLLADSRAGLGFAHSRFDDDELDDLADDCDDEGFGLSVVLLRSSTAREALLRLCEHIDAYLSANKSGQLRIKLLRNSGTVTSIAPEDLAAEPSVEVADYTKTRNRTRIAYTNAARDYKEDAVAWRDPASYSVTGETSVTTLQRPWITRQQVARQVAGATGAQAAIPAVKGKLRVLRGAVEFNAIGQRLSVSYPDLNLSGLVVRIVGQSTPSPGSQVVELSCEADRGYLNAPLYGTADDLYGDGDDLTADAALATKIFETPLRLALPTSGGDQRPPHTLAAVMVRGDLFTNGYNVYLKRGASSFNVIRTDNTFAVRGTLAADYPADTDKIDTRLGFLLNVNSADNDLETPELDEALDGRYLILLGAEILSLVSATLVSGTQFRCYAIRGMFDTIRLAHPAGSEAFIFPRRDLSPFTSKRFALGMVATFKVQPFVDDNERDLSSIGEQTHVITARARRPLPPANLRRCQNATDLHGDAKNPTYKASGGMATIYLRWDLTDPAHDDFWQQWRAVQAPAWSGTETYSRYDRVSHKGGTFTSLVDGNSAIEPGVSGSWQNSWLMETPFETRTVLDFLTLGIGCTLDHTTDKVQKTSHGLANGAKLYLDGATLPPELPPGTLLYVVNATTDDFQLALRANGDAVAFSANGSAVVYSLVKRTVEVGRSKSSYTVTYSTLTGASWFNTSPLDGFIVRAHGKANGLLSTWFIDLKLTREP